jgi:hypothetical protein
MWERIKAFFGDSEVIFWARLQLLLGTVAAAVTYFDPGLLAPVLPAEWLPWAIVANGVATEYLRRRRDAAL